MKRILAGAIALIIGAASFATAQSLDDLNIQLHGYAAQGLLYSSRNNLFTAPSSDGSPAWSDVVLNVSSTPVSKLRIAVQARYFLLGNTGNAISLDWASVDYKADEHIGFRFGKVKTPSSMFNEIQDIDPGVLWSLMPQAVYPVLSRNALLAHDGGVMYGAFSVGKRLGRFDYRAWGGERIISSSDGLFIPIVDAGVNYPNGLSGPTMGASLRWFTPMKGVMLGATLDREDTVGQVSIPAKNFSGNTKPNPLYIPYFFGEFDHKSFMFAAEYARVALDRLTVFTIGPPGVQQAFQDKREMYAMTSYKVTQKITAGTYYGYQLDHKAVISPANYQKDWAISGRYDFNQYFYAKAEQHFIDGAGIIYDTRDNTGGIKPSTHLTLLKVGVAF